MHVDGIAPGRILLYLEKHDLRCDNNNEHMSLEK